MRAARTTALAMLVTALTATPTAAQFHPPQFLHDHFSDPRGVAVDRAGLVYIADGNGDAPGRIVKVDNDGAQLGLPLPVNFDDHGSMQDPVGVAVEPDSDHPAIFYTDASTKKVRKLAPGGQLLIDFGAFAQPAGIEVDPVGQVYVTDTHFHIVARFAPDGTLADVIGKQGGGAGTGSPAFNTPSDLDIDHEGNLYVADTLNGRVMKVSPTHDVIWAHDGLGRPSGIAYTIEAVPNPDPDGDPVLVGRLAVSDESTSTFRILDPDSGSDVGSPVSVPDGPGQPGTFGTAVDCTNAVFVAEPGRHRLARFKQGDPQEVPPCSAPKNTVTPQIEGTPEPGHALRIDLGLDPHDHWSGVPAPLLAIHWQRCSSTAGSSCASIPGEDGDTLHLTEADRGWRFRAMVVAVNDQGEAAEPSNMTPQVPLIPDSAPPPPPAPPPFPGPTIPPASPPTLERVGFARFEIGCPPSGDVSCSVRAEVRGSANLKRRGKRIGKRGKAALARGSAEIRFSESGAVALALTKLGRKLVRSGYDKQAVMRVTVDGERLFSKRVRINRKSAKQFARRPG